VRLDFDALRQNEACQLSAGPFSLPRMARQSTPTPGAAYYELKIPRAAQEGADNVRCVLVINLRKGMNAAYRQDLVAGLAELVLFREPQDEELSVLNQAAFRRLGRFVSNTLTPDGAILYFAA
jgi:hypothetical protein